MIFCAHQHPSCKNSSDNVDYLCYSTAVALSSSVGAFSFLCAHGSGRTILTVKEKLEEEKIKKKI